MMQEVKLSPAEDFLQKYPHMLSGGQQQRVVIARAMILEPKLIVADEPVSMLDASVRVEVLKLLRGLQYSHDLAVVYITHDLSTVRYFSERIFVMYAGKIIEQAKVESLLKNPFHPYTNALLEAIPEPDAENARTFKEVPPGEPPSLVTPPAGCRFHPRCPEFMPGLCDVKEPADFEPEPGHLAACWLYE
jgi:peptide/nickel transport system ATP-binding protein